MLLPIRSLTKVFPGIHALDDVDLDIAAGQVHALLGENGAGKSTLIECLPGAYPRDGGTITLDGAPIDPRSTLQAQKLGIGTVCQEVNLLPNLTVAQNLMFGREPRRFGLIDMRGDVGAIRAVHRRGQLFGGDPADHGHRAGGRNFGQGADPGRTHRQPGRGRGGDGL